MAKKPARRQAFNIMIVGQTGRLMFEAILFAASLRHSTPDFAGRLFVAVPQPGPRWQNDPSIRNGQVLELLNRLDATVLPFENKVFGQSYPHGNKIEALSALPANEPFVFFDTDTLVTGDLMSVPFDFERPTASMKRENTWPQKELYGPGFTDVWKSLYDKFGLDFESSLDLSFPDEYWKRYLYFNAGFFFYRCPHVFGSLFLDYARAIRDDPPDALICQPMEPWLDQIALPLVIHKLGGGRDTIPDGLLDGSVTCHYRLLPLLYARENDDVVALLEQITAPNWIKKVLKSNEVIKRMIYHKRGHKVRNLFDRNDLPRKERAIRNRIKSHGYWMR
ncbi:hypothetical protein [Thalassococcus sp. S3]|uniref:hypothetical protein n=1 Tax=Thalassococcus sp. S3 TaxID=2017482 RepID=UPI0010246689|nr:hypothetical protein [Thalassococcus sp. S3]QBF32418.1 hypothetical protein CFI11_14515 [Thalassococcus sp. S3]